MLVKTVSQIPQDQAPYKTSRSTTKHVFAIKQLAKKARQPNDYKIYILMLDLSKAFESVNRKMLLNHLKQLLKREEMNFISTLINETSLQINNH